MQSDSRDDEQQAQAWELLYDRVRELLQPFGTESAVRKGDYWVHDENWGFRQHKIYVNNLDLLRPLIIMSLQEQLHDFPEWEIVVAIAIRGDGENWPDMGLTIRAHEIIDGLQRHYFPIEFRDLAYARSRPGTERD